MLKLTPDEQTWLEAYRLVLDERFSGLVETFLIFGSKARGDAGPDSDIDVLLVIREGDWQVKESVTHPGYELSIGTDVVPSFVVYTKDEWEARRKSQAPFWQTVTRDGVMVS